MSDVIAYLLLLIFSPFILCFIYRYLCFIISLFRSEFESDFGGDD